MTNLGFAEPSLLWLLAIPAALLALWLMQAMRRTIDRRRLRSHRLVPTPEGFGPLGELFFWCCVIAASATLIPAAARPQAPTTMPQRSGLDVIVLQDASASMRVTDMAAPETRARDRWQHSMQLLRELGDALSWASDRVALIAFAHVATPQVRLTRDPNTLFFFLDHLDARPPYRLEDETTWDTNLEQAIAWGLRVVDKDREIHGRSLNTPMFVMVSDGEAWSGEVAKAVSQTVARGIPLHVVGVGSLGGGALPAVRTATGELLASPGTSRLERGALERIATAGHGEYFELDRDGARAIANQIVASGRRRAPVAGLREVSDDLYWWFLLAAAVVAAAGMIGLRQKSDLGILLVGSIAGAWFIVPLLW